MSDRSNSGLPLATGSAVGNADSGVAGQRGPYRTDGDLDADSGEVVTSHKHEWQPNGLVEQDREQKSPCSRLDDLLWTDVLSVAICRCGKTKRTLVSRKNARRRGDDLRRTRR